MTKISNQYSLTNVLFADTTNGRVGVNNGSPTVALDVTGAGKFSSSVTVTLQNTTNKEGYIVQASTTSAGGSQPAYTFYTAAGSKRWASFLNVGDDKFHISNASNVEVFTITQAGNLGIGNTAPDTSYNAGSWFTDDGLVVGNITNTSGIQINSSPTSTLSAIRFGDGDGANNLYDQGFIGYNHTSNRLTFGANRNTAMVITSAGSVGIGTTTPAVRLQIDGTNNQERFRLQNTDSASYLAFTEQDIRMWRPNDSGSALVLATQAISGTWTGGGGGIEFRPLNTLRMTISANGSIGAPSGTNIYNASDARLKQNISTISYGLDTISALNPVKFNWLDGFESSEDGKDMLGFVAQEVQDVIPEAVESFGGTVSLNDGTTIADTLRVNEKFIIPVLVKAIQEQQTQINELKALINA
jgi:hypothetical protein